MLEALHLKKTFYLPKKKVLTPVLDVSFSLADGEVVGIYGCSGVGKSTVASIVTGRTVPDGGNVYVDGKPLYESKSVRSFRPGSTRLALTAEARRQRAVQLIPQAPYASLDPVQRVGNAVAEALKATGQARSAKEARAHAEELFAHVGLPAELFSRLPYALSGGQAQRVAVARALALNPSVIISDEATSMLDVGAQAQIVNLLLKLNEERGLSLIFVSHDKSLLDAVTKTQYEMADGVLIKRSI